MIYATVPNGGIGGHGISGNDLVIENFAAAVIRGGTGGQAAVGGTGGAAGEEGGFGINAMGEMAGSAGTAGKAGSDGLVGVAGYGGTGIQGDRITVTNFGEIAGGAGEYGGDGISGSQLTISNSGSITAGQNLGSSTGVPLSPDIHSAAIRATAGMSTLTIENGSIITGDLVLSDATQAHSNVLTVTNKTAQGVVDGNLEAGVNTELTITSNKLRINGDAIFGLNTNLNSEHGASLSSETASFDKTTITSDIDGWNQNNVSIVETDSINGISGEFTSGVVWVDGKDASGYSYISSDGQKIQYSLNWYGLDEKANGNFNIAAGEELRIIVELNDVGGTNDWSGNTLTVTGEGNLILTKKNQYSGQTLVNKGMLTTDTEDAFVNTTGITISQGATLNLSGNSQKTASNTDVYNNGALLINSYNQPPLGVPVTLHGNFINSGDVVIRNCVSCAGQNLIINGNFVGNNGTVYLGAVLAGDSTVTDKLSIVGNATGTTWVSIANEGGLGEQTVNGFKIIETSGTVANAFQQSHRTIAGAYDYILNQGDAFDQDMNNWYLISLYIDDEGEEHPIYRPESGSYAGNMLAASTLFNTRLYDRQGARWSIDPKDGIIKNRSLWSRYESTHKNYRITDEYLNTKSDTDIFQVGGDVWTGSLREKDQWIVGIMTGYGYGENRTHSGISQKGSIGKFNGYSAGVYGTWYEKSSSEDGFYLDSWLLYNYFKNTIKGDGQSHEKYKSKGFTASVESGFNLKLDEYMRMNSSKKSFTLRPQGQLIWSGVGADSVKERNGTFVQSLGKGNIQLRLGARLSMSSAESQDSKKLVTFVEGNWIRNSKKFGVQMNGESVYISGNKNVGEIKFGVEGQLSKDISIWGGIAFQKGSQGYKTTRGHLGVQYSF